MPWKDRYTTSDERTLDRIEWPDGAPCAFVVTVDLSPACGPDGITPKELDAEDTEYGMHVGIGRLLDAFEHHRIAATFATPAIIAERWPERVREITARGHEVAAHGERHEDPSRLARAEEHGRIARTTETLAKIAGTRPHGWYSLPRPGDRYAGGQVNPHTIDLLIDAGYDYFGNGLADDIPYYWVTDFATRRSLPAMPYYPHFDDQFFLMFPAPGKGSGLERPVPLHRNWIGELDAARAFGRCFAITIHPHLVAWGGRLGLLEDVLARATSDPRAWNTTGSGCARWFTAAYPAATSLRLEPSIWTDHPGSLS